MSTITVIALMIWAMFFFLPDREERMEVRRTVGIGFAIILGLGALVVLFQVVQSYPMIGNILSIIGFSLLGLLGVGTIVLGGICGYYLVMTPLEVQPPRTSAEYRDLMISRGKLPPAPPPAPPAVI